MSKAHCSQQQLDAYGFDDILKGGKGFISYDDKLGKLSYHLTTDSLKRSNEVDNLRNETAYVAHPWPGRTVYLSTSYSL